MRPAASSWKDGLVLIPSRLCTPETWIKENSRAIHLKLTLKGAKSLSHTSSCSDFPWLPRESETDGYCPLPNNTGGPSGEEEVQREECFFPGGWKPFPASSTAVNYLVPWSLNISYKTSSRDTVGARGWRLTWSKLTVQKPQGEPGTNHDTLKK